MQDYNLFKFEIVSNVNGIALKQPLPVEVYAGKGPLGDEYVALYRYPITKQVNGCKEQLATFSTGGTPSEACDSLAGILRDAAAKLNKTLQMDNELEAKRIILSLHFQQA